MSSPAPDPTTNSPTKIEDVANGGAAGEERETTDEDDGTLHSEDKSYVAHTYDTEAAFRRMMGGDDEARREFYRLLDRDIEERTERIE